MARRRGSTAWRRGSTVRRRGSTARQHGEAVRHALAVRRGRLPGPGCGAWRGRRELGSVAGKGVARGPSGPGGLRGLRPRRGPRRARVGMHRQRKGVRRSVNRAAGVRSRACALRCPALSALWTRHCKPRVHVSTCVLCVAPARTVQLCSRQSCPIQAIAGRLVLYCTFVYTPGLRAAARS